MRGMILSRRGVIAASGRLKEPDVPPPPPMPVEFIEFKFGLSTSPIFTLDNPTQEEDVLLISASRIASNAFAPFPAGWTIIRSEGNTTGVAVNVRQAYRFASAGETVIDGFAFGGGRHYLMVLRNVDPVDPVVASNGAYNGSGPGVTIPPMDAVPDGMLIGGWGSGRAPSYNGTYPITHPIGMTHISRFNTSSDSHPVLIGRESMGPDQTSTLARGATSSNSNNRSVVVGSLWRPKS